jgi:hypothetical protein
MYKVGRAALPRATDSGAPHGRRHAQGSPVPRASSDRGRGAADRAEEAVGRRRAHTAIPCARNPVAWPSPPIAGLRPHHLRWAAGAAGAARWRDVRGWASCSQNVFRRDRWRPQRSRWTQRACIVKARESHWLDRCMLRSSSLAGHGTPSLPQRFRHHSLLAGAPPPPWRTLAWSCAGGTSSAGLQTKKPCGRRLRAGRGWDTWRRDSEPAA